MFILLYYIKMKKGEKSCFSPRFCFFGLRLPLCRPMLGYMDDSLAVWFTWQPFHVWFLSWSCSPTLPSLSVTYILLQSTYSFTPLSSFPYFHLVFIVQHSLVFVSPLSFSLFHYWECFSPDFSEGGIESIYNGLAFSPSAAFCCVCCCSWWRLVEVLFPSLLILLCCCTFLAVKRCYVLFFFFSHPLFKVIYLQCVLNVSLLFSLFSPHGSALFRNCCKA